MCIGITPRFPEEIQRTELRSCEQKLTALHEQKLTALHAAP